MIGPLKSSILGPSSWALPSRLRLLGLANGLTVRTSYWAQRPF